MMVFDLNTKAEESEDMSCNDDNYYTNNTASKCGGEFKKSCIDCQTTRTPCWRSGPAGPKTLCNACGIRYRKRSRSALKLEKGRSESKKRNGKSGTSKLRSDHPPSFKQQWKSKLGEEEQAAFLLMALSYGCVSA